MNTITREEAIEQGLIRYFTGRPCKHGHVTERYTISGNCVECLDERRLRDARRIKQRRAEIEAGRLA